MSAKKKPTIPFGIHKGKEYSVTRQKARDGYVVVNIVNGPKMEINKSLL